MITLKDIPREAEDSLEAEDSQEEDMDTQEEEDTQEEAEDHWEDHQVEVGGHPHSPYHKQTTESW